MSLKVGYCIFYVAFLSILTFLSIEMGTTIISGVESAQLAQIQQEAQTGFVLFDAITFLFVAAVFGVVTFISLVAISTEFQILFAFVVLPLSIGFLWSIIELARGN